MRSDGEQIPGTWRHIFIRNGPSYYLADLFVYADGVIDCWEPVDFEGFRRKIASGWVATTLEQQGFASAHGLASWRFHEPEMGVDGESLLRQVADLIDELNERPDSLSRCQLALSRYLMDRSSTNLQALRDAYDALPAHHQMFALGDQDAKDKPLRILLADEGDRLYEEGPVVTAEMKRRAFEYFADRDRREAALEADPPFEADGVEGSTDPSVTSLQSFFQPGQWPDPPHPVVLQNDYPAPIELRSRRFASATHAYWSLSTSDAAAAEAIASAERPYDAMTLARRSPRSPNWAVRRVAVMHEVLSAKFEQNDALGDYLLSTGDGRIIYTGFHSKFWSASGSDGRNWIGRLLELVRSELAGSRTR